MFYFFMLTTEVKPTCYGLYAHLQNIFGFNYRNKKELISNKTFKKLKAYIFMIYISKVFY